MGAQMLMYAVPILAVLFVLPPAQITSLHGLIDAVERVFTVYVGSVAPDGTVALSGAGSVVGAISAGVFVDFYVTGGDAQQYFSAALTVAIAMTVLAYLLIFPAFVALRIRQPDLARPFRVPGGLAGAWVVSIVATAWSALAAICLLWPGFGTGDPDAALPAGFAGERGRFELLVACVSYFYGKRASRATAASSR